MNFFNFFWLSLFLMLPAMVQAGNPEDLESFETVWSTIKEKHWDLEGTGLDWDKVYKIYKPKVEASKSTAEARGHISDMLSQLRQSHIRIIEQEHAKELDALRMRFSYGSGYPGFKVALVENRLFIVKISPDSDAAAQGLGIGTEVLSIRSEAVGPIIKEVVSAYGKAPSAQLYIPSTLNALFSGVPGKTIPIRARHNNEEVDLEVKLHKPKGKYKSLMNLSGLYYEYQSEVLPNNLGYISFNIFLTDVRTSFVNDITGKLKDTDGLILDLRGNPGGLGILSVTIANQLVAERGKLGEMLNRGSRMFFPIFPQKPIYKAPVAVLIDGGSASTSEILAAGLQDLGRARVFGYRSAGAAQPSIIVDLPNGDRFQYAIADYKSLKGQHLESSGVAPDEITPHTLDSMARKQDAAMEAARSWILKQSKGDKDETF